MPADDQWTVNGGDPRCSVEMTALAWQAGALLSVEIESESRRRARAAAFEPAAEGALLRAAWDALLTNLPAATVGRRVTWTTVNKRSSASSPWSPSFGGT